MIIIIVIIIIIIIIIIIATTVDASQCPFPDFASYLSIPKSLRPLSFAPLCLWLSQDRPDPRDRLACLNFDSLTICPSHVPLSFRPIHPISIPPSRLGDKIKSSHHLEEDGLSLSLSLSLPLS